MLTKGSFLDKLEKQAKDSKDPNMESLVANVQIESVVVEEDKLNLLTYIYIYLNLDTFIA